MWFGYVTFGFVSDCVGRKRTYVGVPAARGGLRARATPRPRTRWRCSRSGPSTAFFATGYFSGFGAVTAELYPTDVRATAQGFTYNIGRVASAAAPYVVGKLAETHGFPAALSIAAAAYALAAVFWIGIPETKGRDIT